MHRSGTRAGRGLAIGLGTVVLLAWLAYAAVFVYRVEWGGGRLLTPESRKLAGQEPQDEWLALFQHGRKVGYSHTRLIPRDEGFDASEELFLRLLFLEETQEVFSTIQAKLAPDHSLKSFTFRLQAGPISFRLKGSVAPGKLVLVTRMAAEERSTELPVADPIYLGSGIRGFLAQQRLKVGESYRLAFFDPSTMSQSQVAIQVEGNETIRLDSRSYEALRVVMDYHGLRVRSWISPYGEVLKEEGVLGMTLVKSDAEEAIKGLERADLVRAAAVVPDRAIPRPRELKQLRIELTGVSGEGLDLPGDRQRWREGQLTIVRESLHDLPAVRIPWRGTEMVRDLQPSLLIQSDAPELKRQAAEILGPERDGLTAVKQISSWVYRQVEKRPTLSIPSALEVWRQRSGDCNEHSVLFAALARAAGIPTRIAAGLLYADGSFFYHAWNEVYLGRWIAVDATLDQVPADPTHVRLILGGPERQVELVRVIGQVGIRVLDYE
ncbi:MAG TPA: transglutaminase-like domain-containing protein [Syntrophobacteria bacterium]|nr:transglutaminase-like domain-containing protein [Syntrophobacteria bacterium]